MATSAERNSSVPDWAKQNFDKLLMSGLFLFMIGVLIHVVHHGSDAGTISWLENTVGQILAALLTLVVSKQLAQRATDIQNTGPGTQTIVTPPEPPKP